MAAMKLTYVFAFTLAACTSPPVTPPASGGASAQVPPAPVTAAPPVETTAKVTPASPGEMTLFVDSEWIDCEGEGPMRCLRVRASESDEWTLLYQPIEGFTFEPGHTYELRVERSEVKNPPADASSLRYRLVAITQDKLAR